MTFSSPRTSEKRAGQAGRRSVKESTTTSSKVTSRYRAMHKTVFCVATEE